LLIGRFRQAGAASASSFRAWKKQKQKPGAQLATHNFLPLIRPRDGTDGIASLREGWKRPVKFIMLAKKGGFEQARCRFAAGAGL